MNAFDYIYRYPSDLTGLDPTNRVVEEELEPIKLKSGESFAVPLYSPFFSDDVTLVSSLKGTLDKDKDFDFFIMDEETTKMSPKALYCGVVIKYDLEEDESLKMTYRTVGHPHTSKTPLITKLIDYLNTDGRPVKFADIKGVPRVHRVAHHPHPASDLVGFNHLISMLERLYDAIVKKNLWDINTGRFTVEDRTRLNEIEELLRRLVDNSEVNQTKLDGLMDMFKEMYTDIPLPAYLSNLVKIVPDKTTSADEGIELTFEGVPEDLTIDILLLDGLSASKTEDISPDEKVIIDTEWVPEGTYRIGAYCKDDKRRSMKTFISVRVKRS